MRQRLRFNGESPNIDAVIICIPDHVHAVAAMACMERGKHVYLEKPLTRTVWEARLLAEAAEKYKVATQMGNQGYSSDGERITSEIIWSGEIGDVTEVQAWTDRPVWPQGIDTLPPEEKVPATLDWDVWLGPASMRPYSSAYLPFKWRGWFDFGCGGLGDMACHLLGAPNMALRLGAPTSVEIVEQEGKNPYTFPTRCVARFDFPARGSMPPVKIFWHTGAKGKAAYRPEGLAEGEPYIGGAGSFGLNGLPWDGLGPWSPPKGKPPARGEERSGTVFIGDLGVLTSDNYGANVRLLPESRHNEYKLPPQLLTRSPGHYQDWIRACKGGSPACSNFSVAGPFTEWIVLGALALHFEGKLEWDSANMRITNNEAANAYIKPQYRKGWEAG